MFGDDINTYRAASLMRWSYYIFGLQSNNLLHNAHFRWKDQPVALLQPLFHCVWTGLLLAHQNETDSVLCLLTALLRPVKLALLVARANVTTVL